MKINKLKTLTVLACASWAPALWAQDCPCDGGYSDYLYDCDGDGTNESCDPCLPCKDEEGNPIDYRYDTDGDGTPDSCTPPTCNGIEYDLDTHCCVDNELISISAPSQGNPLTPNSNASAIPQGSGHWETVSITHTTPTQRYTTYWTWDEYYFEVAGLNVTNAYAECESNWTAVPKTLSQTTCGNSGAIPEATVNTGTSLFPILSAFLSVASAVPKLSAVALPLTIASEATGFIGENPNKTYPGTSMPGAADRIQIGQTWQTKCWISRATYPNGFGVTRSHVTLFFGDNSIVKSTPETVATVSAGSTVQFTRKDTYAKVSYGPGGQWKEVKCCKSKR